jgi:uncharacterized protein (TIGR00661 family)
MYTNKRIVVAPLCWGLGHATRCIPIIRALLEKNTISIASDGDALRLLRREFPELDSFELPSYHIRYGYSSMITNMILIGPRGLAAMLSEKKRANQIAIEWNADVLISDNRFGFRSDKTENIYITHQINIPANNEIIAKIASKIHQRIISNFDECWVPDREGNESLAGKLSQVKIKTPTFYLGPQSRMQKETVPIQYDYTAVLSGPEPQRTILENLVLQAFSKSKKLKFCLVRGTSEKRKSERTYENIDVFDLLTSKRLNRVINASNYIICRSGYTSIMDLLKLDKSATLIPTPGQYEQEYLAKRLNGKYNFKVCQQKECAKDLLFLIEQGIH